MRDDAAMNPPRSDRAVVAFVAAVFAFHHLPEVAGLVRLHDASDLLTPFAVVGTAAAALWSLHAPPRAVVLGFVAAVLYVDGHGIHLSANSIGADPVPGDAGERAHFWDERFGHLWWHLGWFGLAAAIALADRGTALGPRQRAAIVLLLAATLFTNTVEGGTWWLELAATGIFGAWALATRRAVVSSFAGGFALAAALIGIWAAWHGGVPQFSELGWI
jgi:hypothetical protein